METQIIGGNGEPAISIVACLHGNEPAGQAIIDRLENEDLQAPVQCIIANEKAMAEDKRYIDKDCNRAFPGDQDAQDHEQQLAAALLETVRGTTVIDLHTTPSTNTPFCVVAGMDEQIRKLARASGLAHLVDIGYESGGLIQHVPGISIECGRRQTEEAIEQGYEAVRNILAAEDIIEHDHEPSDPHCFTITGEIDRIADVDTVAEDFEQLDPGDTIATGETMSLRAETTFTPVLLAADGYEDRLGYRANHEGSLSAYKTLPDQGVDHA